MRRLLFVVAGLVLFAPFVLGQEQQSKPEQYSAVAMGTGGAVGGKAIQFDFRINRYATDEEVDQLAKLLQEKGQNALRDTLDKQDVGRIAASGSVGNAIAVARKRKTGNGTVITIVTARYMAFLELYQSSRTTDYPFGYMRVQLDEKGQGTGQIIVAAKIRFNQKKGHYELESYGNQYIKVTNVRMWK
jgi:hypothetical protein